MKDLLEIKEYKEDIKEVAKSNVNWEKLSNKTLLISGATGMIGKCLIDVVMHKNKEENLNCKIVALSRDRAKEKERFDTYIGDKNFKYICQDINNSFSIDDSIDFIIHAASNTHPILYANDPIGTITSNVIGTYNLLKLASEKTIERFLFLSSVEIYGENKGDVDTFDEKYMGYINCNTLRAGYPESKRMGESLCQAFMEQKNVDFVIARLSRIFGPSMLMTDSKASSQFIKNALKNEDIVLKSEGKQLYSYCYVSDAVKAILFILLKGKSGEAYNVADDSYNICLKDFSMNIAEMVGRKVIFEIPNYNEIKGYSKATKALMNGKKIKELGWSVNKKMNERISETLCVLSKAYYNQ